MNATRQWTAALQRWSRPIEGRVLGGVCAAIAARTGIHLLLLQLTFAVLTLANGLGAVLYVALWLLLPSEGERLRRNSAQAAAGGRLRHAADELRAGGQALTGALGRARHRRDWPRPLDRFWIGAGIALLGGLVMLASFGAFRWLTLPRALGLGALLLGLGLAWSAPKGRSR